MNSRRIFERPVSFPAFGGEQFALPECRSPAPDAKDNDNTDGDAASPLPFVLFPDDPENSLEA